MKKTALLAVIGMTISCPVVAWWDLGHSAICEVALEGIDSQTRSRIEHLLEPDERFGTACTWPDRIKPARPLTAPWHYINTRPGDSSVTQAKRVPQGDILRALAKQRAVLTNCAKPYKKRQEALRFVGHFVGDLHQPMHLGYAQDWGGNKIKLGLKPALSALLGERHEHTNMHAVWDGHLLVYALRSSGKSIRQLMAQQEVATDVLQDPVVWADESYAILRRPSLRYVGKQRPRDLKEDYLKAHWPVALMQMKKASLRLRKLLQRELPACSKETRSIVDSEVP